MELAEHIMTADRRRAFMQHILERETATGRSIDGDAEFVSLAELWIEGGITMIELRRRYQTVREDRLKQKRLLRSTAGGAPVPYEAFSSADILLAEIGRMSRSEGDE